jgi:hypothetical protein
MTRVPVLSDFVEYAVDAAQRSLLFWDTLRGSVSVRAKPDDVR